MLTLHKIGKVASKALTHFLGNVLVLDQGLLHPSG